MRDLVRRISIWVDEGTRRSPFSSLIPVEEMEELRHERIGCQKSLWADLESKILEDLYESFRAGRNSRVDKVRPISQDFRRHLQRAEAGKRR
jgi:hypothetical protein